ncbi:MAG: VanZ family protein [Flavobacterium sp.]|uniref:VanZ family protein n=1 Tax=Flavobacterium sp. TaxID=239 RepID=UPI00326388D5
MIIKNLLAPNKNAFWVAFFWTLLILYLSLKKTIDVPKFSFPNEDKIVHFTFYLGFVILWYRYLLLRNSILLNNKIALVIISIFFGIAVEFAQKYLTTTRQADIWDVVANSIGTLVGIFVATKLFKENKTSKVLDN